MILLLYCCCGCMHTVSARFSAAYSLDPLFRHRLQSLPKWTNSFCVSVCVRDSIRASVPVAAKSVCFNPLPVASREQWVHFTGELERDLASERAAKVDLQARFASARIAAAAAEQVSAAMRTDLPAASEWTVRQSEVPFVYSTVHGFRATLSPLFPHFTLVVMPTAYVGSEQTAGCSRQYRTGIRGCTSSCAWSNRRSRWRP
jgi:hypothetical protein